MALLGLVYGFVTAAHNDEKGFYDIVLNQEKMDKNES